MNDLSESMIGRFLQPLSCLEMGVIDALYFLRKDGAFVFAEGYCHPPAGLMGKVMLYPHPGGEVEIFGRPYRSTYKKRIVDGEQILIDHAVQLERQFEISPDLDRGAPRPVFEEYHVEFPRSDFRGVFEHRHSLRAAMDIYPAVKEKVESLSRCFSVPLSRLGCTGSACYGKFDEPDDIDLVFCGTVEENKKILQRIKEITRDPRNRVFEFGKLWPIRFYWQGTMICSFFIYRREEEIPLRNCRMEVLEEGVRGEGVVVDDTHSIYMPSVLTVARLRLNGEVRGDMDLIIYDGSLRGEYYRGDRLEFACRRVLVQTGKREFEALLVNLKDNIAKKKN